MIKNNLFVQAFGKFLLGVILISLLLFLPAGSLGYRQGWLLMGILFVPMFCASGGTHGAYLLPYSGVGSGFLRVRELDDKVEVVNDTKKKEVIVTFWRESNQGSVRVTEQSNGVTKKSNQEQQKVTKKINFQEK